MTQAQMFLKEMKEEAQTTRKMLERVPADKFGWQPHPKSMTLKQLAGHVAELPGWATIALTTDGLDLGNNPYEVPDLKTTEELLAFFDRTLDNSIDHLAKATDADLQPNWTLRYGDKVLNVAPKADTVKVAINQTIHHRAQLGVFLRLLDVPIPGTYGPSADEAWS